MDVSVLGRFTASIDGRSVLPRAGKPRQMLALLALHAPQVVSNEALMTELWGGVPPRSAVTTLQTYVMQLRRAIEAGLPPGGDGKAVLVTRHGGYQLEIEPAGVDVHRFRAEVHHGMRLLEQGRDESASSHLATALQRWNGHALEDVERGRHLAIEVVRIEDDALTALQGRIEADLRLGRHHSVVGELAALTDRHPLDEGICMLYMTACYRSGRPHRALEAFARLRRTLVDELGLEPSPRVRLVQQQVLSADPRLHATPRPVEVAAGYADDDRRAG